MATNTQEKRIRVIISGHPGPGGYEPVDLSFNGHACRVQRDQPVDLLPGHYEVLKNAQVSKFVVENGVEREVMVSRYPHSVLSA